MHATCFCLCLDSVTTASTTAELGRSTTQKSSTKTNNYLTNLEPSTTETTPFTNYTRTLLNVSGGVISNKIDLQTTGNLLISIQLVPRLDLFLQIIKFCSAAKNQILSQLIWSSHLQHQLFEVHCH